MATKEEICSRALMMVGANSITSFTDGSSEAVLAGALYDTIVEGAVAAFPWPWCTQDADVGTALAEAPPTVWTYGYAIPTSPVLLEPLALFFNDQVVDFDIRDGVIYSDEQNTGDGRGPIFRYLYRPAEAHFRPLFQVALIWDLASAFAYALDRAERGQALATEAETIKWPKARRAASQGVTASKLELTTLRSARN